MLRQMFPLLQRYWIKKSEHIRKLPISEIQTTDNSKKFPCTSNYWGLTVYLIIQNVDLFKYCFVPIFCWLLHKYHSQFILYQEDKQPRKISERKICAYTRMSEKWGLSDRNPEKSGHSYTYTFCWKKGANHIPGSAVKGGLFSMHIHTMPYIGSYPHPEGHC